LGPEVSLLAPGSPGNAEYTKYHHYIYIFGNFTHSWTMRQSCCFFLLSARLCDLL